ncbi:Histone-arginine methyltransferase carm1 [Podochytrium sp. JEL0797]|nr:Histone-arginine methyltransferase carm1 [Podochytrium sp. JEL0797]
MEVDRKDEDDRDPAYFSYYAQFVHQQNMLQDNIRTSMYHNAIMSNSIIHFKDKLVIDVGAGSGILSYFAAQAGASKVFAIEASGMATKMQKMISAASTSKTNQFMHNKIEVFHSKVEDVKSLPLVDTIVSEPIGVLLLHERMVESFIHARDAFLKPGGCMMPSTGTIFLSVFSDAGLWTQTMAKVRFWEQPDFFGVDLSPLREDAMKEVFAQPVVGNFDHRILLAPSQSHFVDFRTCTLADLKDITIPLAFTPTHTALLHGIAGWFDIDLCGFILSTAPNAERTHWQQVRFVLRSPLAVNAGELVQGWFRMKVNAQRSYDVTVELGCGGGAVGSSEAEWVTADAVECRDAEVADARVRRGKWALQEQTYWYSNDVMGAEYNKPEMLNMYPGVGDKSVGLAVAPAVGFGHPTNI